MTMWFEKNSGSIKHAPALIISPFIRPGVALCKIIISCLIYFVNTRIILLQGVIFTLVLTIF